jgi:hypothetical protein
LPLSGFHGVASTVPKLGFLATILAYCHCKTPLKLRCYKYIDSGRKHNMPGGISQGAWGWTRLSWIAIIYSYRHKPTDFAN